MDDHDKSDRPEDKPPDETKSLIAAWLAYGNRTEPPEGPQRTRFQGSRFDFNGKKLW